MTCEGITSTLIGKLARQHVANRPANFLRESPFEDATEYLEHLAKDANEEDMLVFFDLLSTNVTSFFREREHFDYLEREFYPPLARQNTTRPGRRIRLWSAGCSIGPEPYSMAMHAMEHLPDLDSWDFKILATDLSNTAIEEKPGSLVIQRKCSRISTAHSCESISGAEPARTKEWSRLRRTYANSSPFKGFI